MMTCLFGRWWCFFFQAEDGIRDLTVTGVQTCALPIFNAQDGLFTLVERGLEHGAPVERTRLVGAISRALVADAEWPAVRDVVARPELQVIVSNVTEAGFRSDASFPHRLTDLLQTRFVRLPEGPPVFVIPTELVDDNGPRLAAMVDRVARGLAQRPAVREWPRRRAPIR